MPQMPTVNDLIAVALENKFSVLDQSEIKPVSGARSCVPTDEPAVAKHSSVAPPPRGIRRMKQSIRINTLNVKKQRKEFKNVQDDKYEPNDE